MAVEWRVLPDKPGCAANSGDHHLETAEIGDHVAWCCYRVNIPSYQRQGGVRGPLCIGEGIEPNQRTAQLRAELTMQYDLGSQL